jgi:hypothetical protein
MYVPFLPLVLRVDCLCFSAVGGAWVTMMTLTLVPLYAGGVVRCDET